MIVATENYFFEEPHRCGLSISAHHVNPAYNKVKELLGWQPPESLEDGISSTAEWYIKRG